MFIELDMIQSPQQLTFEQQANIDPSMQIQHRWLDSLSKSLVNWWLTSDGRSFGVFCRSGFFDFFGRCYSKDYKRRDLWCAAKLIKRCQSSHHLETTDDRRYKNVFLRLSWRVFLTKLAMKFAFDSLPAMLTSFGITYPNQSDAEMIALYGYSKARPRQANRKIPRATNLPPWMAAAFASWLMFLFVCEV